MAPWPEVGARTALGFDVAIPSRARKFLRRQKRCAARLHHSLPRERIHVSELPLWLADRGYRKDLRGAVKHYAGGASAATAERLSPRATPMTLSHRTSNQSLQPTADRQENLHTTTSTLKFRAQLGSVSGG